MEVEVHILTIVMLQALEDLGHQEELISATREVVAADSEREVRFL